MASVYSIPDYTALGKIKVMMYCDLNYRSLKRDRVETAIQRLDAAYHLATGTLYEDKTLWNTVPRGTIAAVTLSPEQQRAMDFYLRFAECGNMEQHLNTIREIYIVGRPGSGITALFVQMVAAGITMRHRVLILCPTGQLVASYRQRLQERIMSALT